MMKINAFSLSLKITGILLFTGILLAGCMQKENLYDPNFGKNEKPAESYPDFSTRTEVLLNVDYEVPGHKVLVQVFTEYPYQFLPDGSILTKDNLLPVYAAFTDDNAKLSANISLPMATKKVYLCSPTIGVPSCVELSVTDNKISFRPSDENTSEQARSYQSRTSSDLKVELKSVDLNRELYAFCAWDNYGKPKEKGYFTAITGQSTLVNWLQFTLWNDNTTKPSGLNNSKWLTSEEVTNITILKKMKDENGNIVDVKDASIALTFLSEGAWYQNVFGYYYYPTEQKPQNPSKLKKYIIIPNASKANHPPYGVTGNNSEYYPAENAPMGTDCQQVTLWYVDDMGQVHDKFPSGYTIGWFLISNGFDPTNGNIRNNNTNNPILYSNESLNSNKQKRCISLNYSGKVVTGFEDGADSSYEDLLFYVEANPSAAIYDPNKPNIDDDTTGGGTITGSDKSSGTYAFEDQWPAKGDYDLNDVVVEYERIVTFNNKNEVIKIVDTFKPVQRAGSANYTNAFAYQIDASQIGDYVLPEGVEYEEATHSFIVCSNTTAAKDKLFTITREFKTPFAKSNLKSYNPFIIAKYTKGNTSRIEIHLPKGRPTDYADKSLNQTEDDAYYIDVEGKFPFAIDLSSILNFDQSPERTRIDEFYPKFKNWVNGGCGKQDADWYIR